MCCIKPSGLVVVFLLALAYPSIAQQKDAGYDRQWKKVDSLLTKKGLTQSALTGVNDLYARAKKENNEAQIIKALLYKLNLQATTTEGPDGKSFGLIEQEIATAKDPARSILLSLLAEKYDLYFQQNRWRFYNRSKTINFVKEDIATWSADDLHKKAAELYTASLKNTTLLQQTRPERFDAIIIKGNARYLRPTLYDILAFRALAYFSNEEHDVTRPAYAFDISDDRYFAAAPAFAQLAITTPDSLSQYYRALLIYQQLLAFHAKDTQPDALIDADIDRIQFVQAHATMENKDTLYENALLQVANRYENRPVAAQAFYLLAQLHADRAGGYDPLKTTDTASTRYEYITAVNICNRVLSQAEASEGKANCGQLLKTIRRRDLLLTTEKVNVPGQPFRTLVRYRNTTGLYLRVVALTDALKQQLQNRYDESYWTTLLKLAPLSRWAQSLPATNDYQQHSVEIKTPALPAGEYFLLASADSSFSLHKNPLAAQHLYISNISYISRASVYFILDRTTGRPLEKATAQQWLMQYDYTTRTYKKTKGQTAIADKNGYICFTSEQSVPNRYDNNYQLEIRYNNDRLSMDEYQYIPYRSETDNGKVSDLEGYIKKNTRVFLFTDRAIYRPGQTVYFKGISLTRDGATKKNRILANARSKVYLRNANNQAVDSLVLTTSEWGSYVGKFRLPESGLNGGFSIVDSPGHGTAYFSMEEYKRPKFYVDYEKIKGGYRVNDSITVKGFAKAYAGNTIGGAQVKYRVERTPRFIYAWLNWRKSYPQGNAAEISHGVISTAGDGSFVIRFKAIPDATISKALDPVFDYKVTADVTDLNGETRSHTQTISVSYKALQLTINALPEEPLAADSFRALGITTQNTAGVFEPALVHVAVTRLQAPGRLIRKRYWQQPDQFVMSEESFLQYFPLDEYQNESDYHNWPKAETVWQQSDTSSEQKKFRLPQTLAAGRYMIEATAKDRYGALVKDIRYVELYDRGSKALAVPTYSWSSQDHPVAEPGEKSSITIGSSAGPLFVIIETDTSLGREAPSMYNYTTIDHEKKTFDFPVQENNRGGFGVNHFFVKDNRFYSSIHGVQVPWTNKELTISYQSFRDKTLPGSQEKWTLNIRGAKKEPLAAELLAGMYDASLDQFRPLAWSVPGIWPTYYTREQWAGHGSFYESGSNSWQTGDEDEAIAYTKTYDALISPGIPDLQHPFRGNVMAFARDNAAPATEALPMARQRKDVAQPLPFVALSSRIQIRGNASLGENPDALYIIDGVPLSKEDMGQLDASDIISISVLKDAAATALYGAKAANGVVVITTKSGDRKKAPEPVIRKNFNETAFFFPDLRTDSAGNISFSFTMPEALTRWKFQALAHTKDLAFGYSTMNVVTQKPLMVQPNAPRFLREGDKMELSAKVANMTDKELTGTVQLELFNAATNQPADGWFRNMYPVQYFTAEAGQSTVVRFSIDVPYQYNSALVYRFVAKAGDNSDGEEASLPVLTNRLLVTESMPLPMRGNASRNFKFEKLLQSGGSETLQQHALTVEFTSNPAWYAVQALPYLTEYPYECAEQTFNRYYANALASMIAGASPKLKSIVNAWNTTDTAALLSNLQKNEALKSVLLEETPWVLQAKTETQQKKNIALLFDMVRMDRDLAASFDKLKQMQSANGGFVWFKGGPDDRCITQYILSGIGHLNRLHALSAQQQSDWKAVIKAAVAYADQRIKEDYDYLVKHKIGLDQNNLGFAQVQYLYFRSLFNDYDIPGASFTAVNYYRKQSIRYWLPQNRYMQGMIALSLFRTGDVQTAKDILKSLRQNAVINDELGMYWKDNTGGYYWHQAPVETQSLLIEAFSEIGKDNKIVDDLKTWLLKQKQVQGWATTRATAEACYALLLQGSDWLGNTPEVDIKLGDKTIGSGTEKQEAGTGYFKKTIDGPFVHPSMGDISVRVTSRPNAAAPQTTWGAVYWQYFEQLDKITPAATPLKLTKKLFVEKNTDRGPVLEPLQENAYVKVGDKIKVRIELRSDRDMEYVHMKDMRASCMEPVNVLSGYKWQDGLGYYESTGDVSTNFFFDRMPKGTYVFEYPVFVTHAGNFSNGITSIQCMYAPEFSAHSEGIRVNVGQ